MKTKKITTSHIVLYISWIVLISYIFVSLWWIFKNPEKVTTCIATVITGVGTVLGGSVTLIHKSYYKKSGSENQIKLQLLLSQGIIDLQIKYPWLNLLELQDVSKILGNAQSQLQKDINKTLENVVLEDVTQK